MVRLEKLIKKISEARTFFSPYGESNARNAFYISRGQFRPSSNAIERYVTNLSYGIGAEGKGTKRSNDVTNRSTINDIASTVSKLVSSGKINPRRRDTDLLKRKKLNEEKLRVFDFDDTVAKTKSKILIKNKKSGKIKKITPAQFSRYTPKKHEQTDFSQFNEIIKPKRVKEIHKILKNLAKKKRNFMILTARANKSKTPIKKYLKKEGLYHAKRVRITTVNSSDPEAKSKTIQKHLNTGKYSHLEFFDDSDLNVKAVNMLKDKYPHIKIKSRKVNYSEKIK